MTVFVPQKKCQAATLFLGLCHSMDCLPQFCRFLRKIQNASRGAMAICDSATFSVHNNTPWPFQTSAFGPSCAAPTVTLFASIIRAETWLCSAAVRGCCAGSWNMCKQAVGCTSTSPPQSHQYTTEYQFDLGMFLFRSWIFAALTLARDLRYDASLPDLHAAPSRPASSALRHMMAERRTI
jgi:hypothetical protein